MPNGDEKQILGQDAMEGRPLWQACCIGCLFVAAALVAGSFAAIGVFAGSGFTSIKSLPPGFPEDLKPYMIEQATEISYLSGSERGKFFRIVTAPVRLAIDIWPKKEEPEGGVVITTVPFRVAWSAKSPKSMNWFDKYSHIVQGLDSVTFVWDGLDMGRDELAGKYAEIFRTAGMKIEMADEKATNTDFLVGSRPGAAMQVHIQTADDGSKVQKAVVTVTYTQAK